MYSLRLSSVLLLVGTVWGCTDQIDTMRLTPASENDCNVSCGFDHEKNKTCLEDPAVLDYAVNGVFPGLIARVRPILERQPTGACFCGIAILDEFGKFTTVTVADATSVSMGNEIRSVVLEASATPIPSSAECIVGIEFPLSFNR